MTGRGKDAGSSHGFSLLELMVALLLFQIGLLAVAGLILLAQENLRESDLVLRAAVEGARVGDSLLRVGEEGNGWLGTS